VKGRAGNNDAGVEASVAFRSFAALCAYSAMTFTRPAAPARRVTPHRPATDNCIASAFMQAMLVPTAAGK